jgi:hypothetical protein
MTVKKFKLVAISDDFSDAQVIKLLPIVTIKTKGDISKLLKTLRKRRPKIYQKLEQAVLARRSRPK